MNSKTLDEITDSIKNKLGDENFSIIGDDIGMLITENNKSINTIDELNKNVSELKNKNDLLVSANSRLLSQIPMEKDDAKEREENEESSRPKEFTLMDLFDDKGHFKKR